MARTVKACADADAVMAGEEPQPLEDEVPRINAKGSLLNAGGFAIHEDRLNSRAESIDPNVRVFLERGRAMSSADLIRLQRGRAPLVSAMDLVAEQFDVLIMPTTKIVAPLLSEIATPRNLQLW